jgi:hypothetical protein
MIMLIKLLNQFRDLKTGYYVGIYDTELDSWVHAYAIRGDRFVVTDGNLEIKLSSPTGYNACVEASKWFKEMRA